MRIHDGSPPPVLQSEISVEGSAPSGGIEGPSCSLPGDSAMPPVRGVLVSHDEFKKRRQLRRRVKAAFEKFQQERPLDVERPAGTPAPGPGAEDETP
jgi:hypothetical protein